MKVFEALNRVGNMVDAGIKGTFTLTVRDEKQNDLAFVIDAEKETLALTGFSEDEAGDALAGALVKGYEVVGFAWKGTDL